MLVRIRLGQGRRVRQEKRAIRRLALGAALLLQPPFLASAALALWRFGSDLGWTGEFVIASGPLSHWQTWMAIAVLFQACAIALNRYGNASPLPKAEESEPRKVLKSEFDRVL
jgi:hypothetical protein